MRSLECPECDGEYNHITSIRVQLGDDDYNYTDAVLLRNVDNLISVTKTTAVDNTSTDNGAKSSYRLRGELQPVIILECEECGCIWERFHSHHKGVIYTNDVPMGKVPQD